MIIYKVYSRQTECTMNPILSMIKLSFFEQLNRTINEEQMYKLEELAIQSFKNEI